MSLVFSWKLQETLERALTEITDILIEEAGIEIIIEKGKELRWGELTSGGILDEVSPELSINESAGVDIFGQILSKKPNFECECPKCNRMLAAARFAPHLEKCMGMGRNSSRIASRRLAASSSSNAGSVGSSDVPSKSSSAGSNGSTASGSQVHCPPSLYKYLMWSLNHCMSSPGLVTTM
jgi:SAGA-associated factor 11